MTGVRSCARFFVQGTVIGPNGKQQRLRFHVDSGVMYALAQGKRHTQVMLGERGDEAVLGSLTLAAFGLLC